MANELRRKCDEFSDLSYTAIEDRLHAKEAIMHKEKICIKSLVGNEKMEFT